MSELKTLAVGIMHYIQQDLCAFEVDYKDSPDNFPSLPALRFMKRELEELWSNINEKFKQIRKLPQRNDPEIFNSINLIASPRM